MRMFSISSKHWLWLIRDLGKHHSFFLQLAGGFQKRGSDVSPCRAQTWEGQIPPAHDCPDAQSTWCFCFLGADNEKTLIFFPKFDSQFGSHSKSWDFSYLSFTFSFTCAALANRGSRSRAGAVRLEQENTGTFPVLQELLWLLCIFKGLTLSHGEPL